MSETKWKKQFPSSSPNPDSENVSVYDDIVNMQNKIKNMYNRKNAREYKENYKNIELFQNIYRKMMDEDEDDEDDKDEDNEDDDDEDEDNSEEDEETDNEEEKDMEGMTSKKKKKKKTKKVTMKKEEPLPATTTTTTATTPASKPATTTKQATPKQATPKQATPKPAKNEIKTIGDLNKYIFAGLATVSSAISNVLFYIPQNIDNTLTKYTTDFTKMFSEKDASPNRVSKDENILKQFIYQLVAFIVAVWVALNWFFLMVFKTGGVSDCGESQDTTGRCYPANDNARFKVSFEGSGKLQSIFDFFFKFSITPLWLFDKYAMGDDYGKTAFSYIPWKNISHFLILVLSFVLVYSYNFFTMIKDILDGKLGIMNIFIITSICGLFFLELYNTFMAQTFNNIDFMTPSPDTFEKVKGMFVKTMSPITWLFIQFLYFVVLLAIAAFSVNIGAVILILFVWFLSIFAIPYYMGASNIWNTVQNLYKYISEDFIEKEEDKYMEVDIIQKILRAIAGSLHKNMYYIGFIALMAYNLIQMNVSLNSATLKQVMSAIIVVLIGLMASFMA